MKRSETPDYRFDDPFSRVPTRQERVDAETRRRIITRRSFLFGGFIASAATIITAFLKRKDIVKGVSQGVSHIGFEKLAGDMRRHLSKDAFHIRNRPKEVQIAQMGDILHYPQLPPQYVGEIIENSKGQERFQEAIENLYYNGIINCEGLSDEAPEKDVKAALNKSTSLVILRAINERIGNQRIDSLNPDRKVKGAIVDDTHAASEILDYLTTRPNQTIPLPIVFNRPPYHEETNKATGKVIAFDRQHEAALIRRRARKKTQVSVPMITPVTATPVAAAGSSYYRSPYHYELDLYEKQHKEKVNSRRRFLKALAGVFLGVPIVSGISASVATTIDSSFSFGIGLDTLFKDKINKEELNKLIEKKLPLLMNRPLKIPGIMTMTSRDGTPLSQLAEYNQYRKQVAFSELPPHLINGIIAVEDENFWNNTGVEFSGIARALKTGVGGGATITQQLVERLCWTEEEIANPSKDYTKKMAEILLSAILENQLEREFREQGLGKNTAMRKAKETIMEAYCNMVPFGAGVYGVKAAAEYYFGKPIKDLTLAQSTFLAGMPQGPGFFDPHYVKSDTDITTYLSKRHTMGNISTAQYEVIKAMPKELIPGKTRQAVVLNRMVASNIITPQQADSALNENIQLLKKEDSIKRRTPLSTTNHIDYYAQYVREQLKACLPPELIGTEMTVATTIDLQKQRVLEETVDTMVPQLAQYALDQVAVFVRNIKTGEVIAVYGNQTNRHPPGSSVKPMTYAMALERGDISHNGLVADVEIDVHVRKDNKDTPWKVTNWGFPALGMVNWKSALAQSFNCAAANTAMKMGTMQLADSYERAGVLDDPTSDSNIGSLGWTMTLGTFDTTPARMATAYGTIGNQGIRVDPAPIVSIKDPEGKEIYHFLPERQHGIPVYNSDVTHEIVDALGNNTYRPNTAGWAPLLQQNDETPFFSKTGTAEPTELGGHGWTVGVSGDYAIAVYTHFKPESNGSGLLCAAPIFREVKKRLIG